MKRICLALLAAVLAHFPANAQQPGGGFGGFGGFGVGGTLTSMLHTNKALQDELKLADDQIEKFKDFAAKNAPAAAGGDMGMGRGGRGGIGGAGGIGGMINNFGAPSSDLDTVESLETQLATAKARVEFTKKTLSKEQYERFTQLENQRLAQLAFITPRIAKELKITDDQKKRFNEINADLGKEIQTLMQGAFQGGFNQEKMAEMNTKRNELNNYALEAMEKELTEEQKSAWAKMTGKKFDVSKLTNPPRMRTEN
jgi:hypothetical protein